MKPSCGDVTKPFQDAGCEVVETIFPRQAETQLTEARLERNAAVLRALQTENVDVILLRQQLLSGSRAEGLALEDKWGHHSADCDTMLIYGRPWAVHIPPEVDRTVTAPEVESRPYLKMISYGSPPGFCHVQIQGSKSDMADHLKQSIERGAYNVLHIGTQFAMAFPQLPSWFRSVLYHIVIPSYSYLETHPSEGVAAGILGLINQTVFVSQENVDTIFIERNGEHYLSSSGVLELLSVRGLRHNYQGPSQQVGNMDLVPSLVCSRPFHCIQQYLRRPRTPHWPSPQALEDIQATLGVLVPTDSPGNLVVDRFQWRYSFSPQELRLCQDMPSWVKSGYRAFKYTLKAVYKRIQSNHRPDGAGYVETEESRVSRKSLCSFHMKTVLLWTLEDPIPWEQHCMFRLTILLLIKLDCCLETGTLPHYFNPSCNLLEFLSREELLVARDCVAYILDDPPSAMFQSPSGYRQQSGWWGGLGAIIDQISWKNQQRACRVRFIAALEAAHLSDGATAPLVASLPWQGQ